MAWECETKDLLNNPNVINAACELHKGNMAKQKTAERRLLDYDPANREMLRRIEKCKSMNGQFFCGQPYCSYCSNPQNSNYLRNLRGTQKLKPGKVNYIGPWYLRPNSWSKRMNDGKIMAREYEGLNNSDVAPATINLAIIVGGSDYQGELKRILQDCKQALNMSGLGNARIFLRSEEATVRNCEAPSYLPRPQPNGFLNITDDTIVMFVHVHGLIYWPEHSPEQIREELVAIYPHMRQVCVRQIQEEVVQDNGQVTHGAQGYAEYACKEMTKAIKPRIREGLTDEENDALNLRDAATGVFADAEFRRETKGMSRGIKLNIPRRPKPLAKRKKPTQKKKSIRSEGVPATGQIQRPAIQSQPPRSSDFPDGDSTNRFKSSLPGYICIPGWDDIICLPGTSVSGNAAHCVSHKNDTSDLTWLLSLGIRVIPSVCLPVYMVFTVVPPTPPIRNWWAIFSIRNIVFKRYFLCHPIKRVFEDQEEEPP